MITAKITLALGQVYRSANLAVFFYPGYFEVPHLLRQEKISTTKEAKEKEPAETSKRTTTHHHWNIFVSLPSGPVGKPPKLPPDKGWLEVLLLVLKVGAAIAALVKAVGLLS